jgi:hypothetical protein
LEPQSLLILNLKQVSLVAWVVKEFLSLLTLHQDQVSLEPQSLLTLHQDQVSLEPQSQLTLHQDQVSLEPQSQLTQHQDLVSLEPQSLLILNLKQVSLVAWVVPEPQHRLSPKLSLIPLAKQHQSLLYSELKQFLQMRAAHNHQAHSQLPDQIFRILKKLS